MENRNHFNKNVLERKVCFSFQIPLPDHREAFTPSMEPPPVFYFTGPFS